MSPAPRQFNSPLRVPRSGGPKGSAASGVRKFFMKLTNESYIIYMGTKNFTERYYRDEEGWLKVSARGRKFRMTAEQVLNHLLPAVAGVKLNLILKVEHREVKLPKRVQD